MKYDIFNYYIKLMILHNIMVNDTFIALNIIYNGTMPLHKNYPIIFYWNGENSPIEEIKNNEVFSKVISEFFDIKYYDNVELYVTTVDKSLSNEKTYKLQNLYPLDTINLEEKGFNKFILDVFYNTYSLVTSKQYEIPIDGLSFENIIADIYEDIQHKLNRKISKDTFLNYILSVFDEKTKLTYENKKILIDLISNYLKES